MPPTVPATRKTYSRAVGPEPVVDRRLVAQVELLAGGGQRSSNPSALQAAEDGRAHQAAVAGDVDARGMGDFDHRKKTLPQG